MRLLGTYSSPFVRKIRIFVAERQIDCPFVHDHPRRPGAQAHRWSPIGKVPILVPDDDDDTDGGALYDSPVILEWLDARAGDRWLPADGPERWALLRSQAVADGLIESVIKVWLENRRPDARTDITAWEQRRIDRVLATLHTAVRPDRFGLAELWTGVALDYLDFRLGSAWRAGHEALAAFLDQVRARASFRATAIRDDPA